MTAMSKKLPNQIKPYTEEDKRKGFIVTVTMGGYFTIGVLLAFVIPDGILAYPWAANFVSWMAGFIPQIAKAGARSPIPGIAQFYSAVMWLLAPLVLIVLLRNISEYSLSLGAEEFRKHKWFMLFFAVIFIPVAMYYAYAEPGSGMGRMSRAMLSSRAGLGLLHSMTFWCVPFFFAGFIAWCRVVPRVYFGKNFH